MQGERDVTGHSEHVGDGEPSQDAVNGSAHVPAREHCDVDEVHGDAEETHQQAQVAVNSGVPLVE